jgi:hypothetical protein
MKARGFEGLLAEIVAERCVDALKRSGHLPQSHGIPASAPPMQLPRAPFVVGRGADMEAVRQGLRDKNCVLLTGGPGEGKSTVARAVGAALWHDEGAYQQGAFEIDMTGGQDSPVACKWHAVWPAKQGCQPVAPEVDCMHPIAIGARRGLAAGVSY